MSSNCKLYRKYTDAKRKIKRIRTITPISVVANVNSIPTHTTTIPTLPLTQASTFTDNLPMLARQINFDRFEEVGEAAREVGSVGIDNKESIDIHDTDNEEEGIDTSLAEEVLRVDSSNHDSDEEIDDGAVNYFGQQCDYCRRIVPGC